MHVLPVFNSGSKVKFYRIPKSKISNFKSLSLESRSTPTGTCLLCICRLPISLICILFVGLPLRAMPNHKLGHNYVKTKDQMVDRSLRRLCVSHSPFNGADFCREGTSHFRSSGKQIWKAIWNLHKIIAWSYWPYICTR